MIGLKVIPQFPVRTSAGAGIQLAKSGDTWTFALSQQQFNPSVAKPSDTVLLWNGTNYFRVYASTLQTLPSQSVTDQVNDPLRDEANLIITDM